MIDELHRLASEAWKFSKETGLEPPTIEWRFDERRAFVEAVSKMRTAIEPLLKFTVNHPLRHTPWVMEFVLNDVMFRLVCTETNEP